MALSKGFLFDLNDNVGQVMMDNGRIMEVPARLLKGRKVGDDMDMATNRAGSVARPTGSSTASKPKGKVKAPKGVNGRQAEAVQYLVKKGWKPHQAQGIVARLIQESGPKLNTSIKGDQGTAVGIAQWRGLRQKLMRRHATKVGGSWDSFEGQLDFVDWEIRNREHLANKVISRAKTAEEAAVGMMHYERPIHYKANKPTAGHGWSATAANARRLSRITGLEDIQMSNAPNTSVDPQSDDEIQAMIDDMPDGESLPSDPTADDGSGDSFSDIADQLLDIDVLAGEDDGEEDPMPDFEDGEGGGDIFGNLFGEGTSDGTELEPFREYVSENNQMAMDILNSGGPLNPPGLPTFGDIFPDIT